MDRILGSSSTAAYLLVVVVGVILDLTLGALLGEPLSSEREPCIEFDLSSVSRILQHKLQRRYIRIDFSIFVHDPWHFKNWLRRKLLSCWKPTRVRWQSQECLSNLLIGVPISLIRAESIVR